MFITKIIVDKYKPLMHNGIKHLEVDDISKITILSGENGSGKSSLLRELTPYPSTRTDYEKNGYRVLEISHENSLYTLTSDFSKVGAHSFKKDDNELNTSGTTEVQTDLVNAHFGYSNLIDKLVSGQSKVCHMGKPERKQLIMSTYPSDLTFILDYHKQLCSRIRACQNNLKMLNERKLKLQDSLISENLRKMNVDYRDDLLKLVSAIDRDLFMLRHDNEPNLEIINEKKEFIPLDSADNNLTMLYNKFINLVHLNTVDLKALKDISREIGKVDNELQNFNSKVKDLEVRGEDLKNEIEQLSQYLSSDTEAAIKQCKDLIAEHTKIISDYIPDSKIPILSEDELTLVNKVKDSIMEDVYTLSTCGHWLWGSNVYNNATNTLYSWKNLIGMYHSEYVGTQQNIDTIEEQINEYSKTSYPSDCVRSCKMRESIETVVGNLKKEQNKLLDRLRQLGSEIKSLEKRYNLLQEALSTRCPERQIIAKLEGVYTNKTWGKFLTSDASLIFTLNRNPTKIVNNLKLLIDENEKALKVKKSKEMLVTLETNLRGLTASNIPTKQFINKSIVEKQTTLRLISEELAKCDDTRNMLSKKACILDDHVELNKTLNSSTTLISEGARVAIAKESARVIFSWIDELEDVKKQVILKLAELDQIIKEQDSFLTRLNDEVQPNINELSEKLMMYQAIEKQISPISGIPHLYILRYVNAIFKLANGFIRRVWNYDMELAYFKEEDNFDYTFKILLNQESEVKDVSICSEGQKAIINLAVTLAICSIRSFSSQYFIKLDEFTNGLSSDHVNKLMMTLGDTMRLDGFKQVFMVSHDIVVCDAFPDASWISLSEDSDLMLPKAKKVIGQIKRI